MKKLMLFLAGVAALVVLGVIAITVLINPNQFKPLLVEQTKQHTGLELVIEGDIDWQFFPSLGFTLGQTELRNPAGFSQPNLFKVAQVGIDVSVMPLLSQQLEIGQITLDGASFYLQTLADGTTNLDAVHSATASQPQQSAQSAPTTEQAQSAPSDWRISLAGINISNGLVSIENAQTDSHTKLYDLNLTLSEFALDAWSKMDFAMKGETNQQTFTANGTSELKLATGFSDYQLRNLVFEASYADASNQIESAKIELASLIFDQVNPLKYAVKGRAGELELAAQGSANITIDKALSQVQMGQLRLYATLEGAALPQTPMNVSMNSELTFDVTNNHLSFVLEKLTANALEFDGKLDVTLATPTQIVFNLHSPDIDLDAFLGLNQPSESKAGSSDKGASPAGPEQEPDLSALNALDLTGAITIDKFQASNVKMQNVSAKFTIDRGIVTLSSFHSDLYGGSIDAKAVLDARKSPATYTAKKVIKGVQVQPLLMDVAQNDTLEGTGNIDADVKGKGLTPTSMKQNLQGTIKINFADGAVNGINIAQLIRENYAKFKGQSVADEQAVKKTDFSAMTATLTLNKGVVSTNNLQAQSPLLRVRGEGSANYLKETLDFTVSTSIVGSLEGQGGKDIDELKDLTIPVNISGAWADPKFKLVFDDVLKQKAEKEINRGLEKLDEKLGEKIKDEKTKKAVDGLLKNLFN